MNRIEITCINDDYKYEYVFQGLQTHIKLVEFYLYKKQKNLYHLFFTTQIFQKSQVFL